MSSVKAQAVDCPVSFVCKELTTAKACCETAEKSEVGAELTGR